MVALGHLRTPDLVGLRALVLARLRHPRAHLGRQGRPRPKLARPHRPQRRGARAACRLSLL